MQKTTPSSWDTPLLGREKQTVKAYGYAETVRLRTDPKSDPLMDDEMMNEIKNAITEVYYTRENLAGDLSLREDLDPPLLLATVEYDKHTNFNIQPEVDPAGEE